MECKKHGPWSGTVQCPVCNRENRAAWVEQNHDKHRATIKTYRDARRPAINELARTRTQEVKTQAITEYGGQCACCGISDLVFLTIDHPDGDGAAHRRAIFGDSVGRAGERFYRWLRREGWPTGFRVLCWNCQHATSKGICPHMEPKN